MALGQYKGVDINQGSQDQIMAQMATIDGNAPVTTTSIAPVQPFKIPPSEPTTKDNSFASYLENLSTATSSAKQGKDDSFQALMSSLTATEGETALQDKAYSTENGVDTLGAELQDLNAQLRGEQEGLRRNIEALQDNAQGLSRTGVAGTIDEARRKSLRTQADLAVVQMAKQGQYDSAKAIADRAIAVQLEKQKQRNERLQFIYQENKDQFNKSEQREFETKQKERDRILENEEYRLRLEFDAKIKQADPMYQAQLETARLQAQKLRNELAPTQLTPLKAAKVKTQIDEMRNLATGSALSGAVGPNKFARSSPTSFFTGAKQNFVGAIEQLRGDLTVEKLQQAKAEGAVFGGLSDGERETLAAAATRIGSWVTKNEKGEVTGYNVDEASFRQEIDKINNFAKLDYVLRGGDAAEIGIKITPDGAMWTENSDGTLTQLQ